MKEFLKKISCNTALIVILLIIIAGFFYLGYMLNADINNKNETFTFSNSVKEVETQVKNQMLDNPNFIQPMTQENNKPLLKSEKVVYNNIDKSDLNNVVNGAYKVHSKSMLPEVTLYYAMWCGYSRAFLPEWTRFEELAKKHLPNIKVSNVRCEEDNENMCIQKGIEGYPTILLYLYDGREIKYDGERKAEDLIKFINQYVKN